MHLCLTSDTSGTVLPVQGIDHALDELAAVQPHETTSPSGIVEALEALSTDPHVADAPGARAVLARSIADGNAGHARIPGKHGAPPATYAVVSVVVDDRPGEVARLLTDIGDAGVNMEDLRLDHGLGLPFGLAEVSVLPAAAGPLTEALTTRGWQLHS